MTPAILQIGTRPTYHYWVWGNKKISEYQVGDKIKFKRQNYKGRWWWESGEITGFCSKNIPMVEYI